MNGALSRVLDGIDVVALVTNVPGPVTAARLCALGATVTKVEPIEGDPLARASASWYAALTEGLTLRRMALRDREARAELRRLVERADVVVTSMRAGALTRLGLDWDHLHAVAPRTIHVAIVGHAAPDDDRVGHDLTYQAQAGLVAPPHLPRTLIADLGAAERAVTAVLAGLLLRARTDTGTRVDVSIVEAAEAAAAPLRYGLTSPGGPLGGGFDGYALYRASDGWVAFAALEGHFAARSCALLGVRALEESALRDAFVRGSVAHWERLAAEHALPIATVVGSEVSV